MLLWDVICLGGILCVSSPFFHLHLYLCVPSVEYDLPALSSATLSNVDNWSDMSMRG